MLKPTINCNQLRKEDIGKTETLAGWVASWRDHGGVIFIDIRDIFGVTQIVFGKEEGEELSEQDKLLIEKAHKLRNEYVIAVRGLVRSRPEATANTKIDTGEIEIVVQEIEVLNTCKELPFDLKNMGAVGEEARLKYRYLEMRCGELKNNLVFKHKVFQETRNFFSENGFYEIETPFLTRSTPEGARDFLVPSRLNQGNFYALPQSPQLFKQILMVGGMMRYFQIVKCFRDEDLRQDRQPEFTQVDLEMSFIDTNDIKTVLERYIQRLFKQLLNIDIELPFKVLNYHESMKKYGSDKPDLRNPLEIIDITELAKGFSFKVFNEAAKKGVVRGLKVSPDEQLSLSNIDKLTKEVQNLGAKGLAWMRHKDGALSSQITKFFNESELSSLQSEFNTQEGDMIFFIADSETVVCRCLSYLRDSFFVPNPSEYKFIWVEDYPLFEKSSETGDWTPIHHPFTAPHPEDINILETKPGEVRSLAYDMVLNGSEIGGGSIRIHSPEIQDKVFKILKLSREESEKKFGFLLKALSYGAPPHGGFAFGVDRLVTKMLNLESIRDVIPFPKTQRAYSPLSDAPNTVDVRQLDELGISLQNMEE
ncbi:aspartate--tRNA ligase [Elusimicrobiota bacterium]